MGLCGFQCKHRNGPATGCLEAIRAKVLYGGSGKRGKFCESPVDEEIFAELTRPKEDS